MTVRRPGETLRPQSQQDPWAAADVRGMRIVIANWRDPWHPQAGGAERYIWEMACALAQRGATVRFLTARAPGQARGEHRDGIEIVRRGGRFTVYPRAFGWLVAHRRWADVVIDCQNGIPFFTPLALPRRVPVLCVVHHVHTAQFGVHFPVWMAWVGRLLEGPASRLAYRGQGCVAVSPSTVTAMRERLRWTGDIYLIPNGTPPPAAPPLAGAASPGTASPEPVGRRPRLVWIGRLVAHKRAELLAGVAARGFTIEVIGRGPGATALSAAVEAVPDMAGEVRLRGYLSEEDKQAIVAQSLLHLNTSQGEGWGLCVLEAAALGVPTVAYDVEGLRDSVRDGQTGWLVREGEELADVVERVVKELADPGRHAEVAAACRHWAGLLSWERSTARMVQLIAACVRLGTSRGTRAGAWIVSPGDLGEHGGLGGHGGLGETVAEGPVLDLLLGAGGAIVRRATPTERLLGEPDGAAGPS
jgi:glycosyltransferase involved in cell wall biosynthesis